MPIESEENARRYARRSIVLARNVPAGHRLETEDLTCKRPGTGVSPLYWDEVLGRTVTRGLQVDELLQWSDLSDAH